MIFCPSAEHRYRRQCGYATASCILLLCLPDFIEGRGQGRGDNRARQSRRPRWTLWPRAVHLVCALSVEMTAISAIKQHAFHLDKICLPGILSTSYARW
ncbi:hypothetical protein PLICRDRAFT_425156 [Plicaturopsis crispa FD-325 SS-3]|nr:hypothetical protein PLICRDRAFT_425156 [Plicaturopsis crispa FD-325 SS-3]